jgi:3-hydroxybutyryl-CoA dehydrogenase
LTTHGIHAVCIVGAGFMGWQIALHCAYRGFDVAIAHRSLGSRQRAEEAQAKTLDAWVESGRIRATQRDEIAGRLRYTQDLSDACRDADLVIEAIGERIDPSARCSPSSTRSARRAAS